LGCRTTQPRAGGASGARRWARVRGWGGGKRLRAGVGVQYNGVQEVPKGGQGSGVRVRVRVGVQNNAAKSWGRKRCHKGGGGCCCGCGCCCLLSATGSEHTGLSLLWLPLASPWQAPLPRRASPQASKPSGGVPARKAAASPQHTQVRLTGRLQQLLPSFLPAILGFGAAAAVDKVVVDDERHILYVLAQPTGTIQVCAPVRACVRACVCVRVRACVRACVCACVLTCVRACGCVHIHAYVLGCVGV